MDLTNSKAAPSQELSELGEAVKGELLGLMEIKSCSSELTPRGMKRNAKFNADSDRNQVHCNC